MNFSQDSKPWKKKGRIKHVMSATQGLNVISLKHYEKCGYLSPQGHDGG